MRSNDQGTSRATLSIYDPFFESWDLSDKTCREPKEVDMQIIVPMMSVLFMLAHVPNLEAIGTGQAIRAVKRNVWHGIPDTRNPRERFRLH